VKFIIYLSFFSLGSWGLAAGFFFPDVRWEMFLGMIAPLTVGVCTIIYITSIHTKIPKRTTNAMTKAFMVKIIFYGTYFIYILTFYTFNPVPFVISFVCYFITLHISEALFFKSIFK
jgi:hypothetical protein